MTEAQPNLADCPKAYANGFGIGYSKTECGIAFLLNQEPAIQILLPFPVALALAENLRDIISDYETASKLKVPKIKEILIDSKTATKG